MTGHLGLETRLAYATLYDEFRNYSEVRNYERDVWNELLDFGQSGPLEQPERLRLRGLIERGRLFDRLTAGNWPVVKERAQRTGIARRVDPDLVQSDPMICRPLKWERV